jgi:hypothetical protein
MYMVMGNRTLKLIYRVYLIGCTDEDCRIREPHILRFVSVGQEVMVWIIAKADEVGFVYAFKGDPTPKKAYALWKSGAAYCGHRLRFIKLVRTMEEAYDWCVKNKTHVCFEDTSGFNA